MFIFPHEFYEGLLWAMLGACVAQLTIMAINTIHPVTEDVECVEYDFMQRSKRPLNGKYAIVRLTLNINRSISEQFCKPYDYTLHHVLFESTIKTLFAQFPSLIHAYHYGGEIVLLLTESREFEWDGYLKTALKTAAGHAFRVAYYRKYKLSATFNFNVLAASYNTHERAIDALWARQHDACHRHIIHTLGEHAFPDEHIATLSRTEILQRLESVGVSIDDQPKAFRYGIHYNRCDSCNCIRDYVTD